MSSRRAMVALTIERLRAAVVFAQRLAGGVDLVGVRLDALGLGSLAELAPLRLAALEGPVVLVRGAFDPAGSLLSGPGAGHRLEHRLDEVDRHREDDRRVLLAADL